LLWIYPFCFYNL